MIYFYCTSWQFFQMIVKWRISPTTEQIMFTFSILLFHFYSHIPYGMWRIPKLKHFVLLRFLLTHPVWDVTLFSDIIKLSSYNFYSHIPCGMWRLVCKIHRRWRNFYSHIPCGMWPVLTPFSLIAPMSGRFLLTHPVWDVTLEMQRLNFLFQNFYSHIPCGMWPTLIEWYNKNKLNFYSHIPCGMWLASSLPFRNGITISTHTSRVGCDCNGCQIIWILQQISTHTSRVGCDA